MSVHFAGTIMLAFALVAIAAAWVHDGTRNPRQRRAARVVFWVAASQFWAAACVVVVVSNL